MAAEIVRCGRSHPREGVCRSGSYATVPLLVGCALALLASSCGEDAATAKANFCKSVSDFSSTVMSYQALDPATATNDELNNAANDIENAWDDVVNEAEDWANADDNALTEAYDDLYWAVQWIPGDYTVAESLEALEPELSAFPLAFRETFDGSGCSST
jgi:hypothetical protein